MPTFVIHEAIAKKINEKYNFEELPFLIGSVAPDSWHCAKHFGNENRLMFHFQKTDKDLDGYDKFYEKYKNFMDNPFYVGYYIHLLTDVYFKKYVYPKYHYLINSSENIYKYHGVIKMIDLLHYKLIKKYNIEEINNFNEFNMDSILIDEFDMSGLHDDIIYMNKIISTAKEEKEIIKFEDITKDVENATTYVLDNLEKIMVKVRK